MVKIPKTLGGLLPERRKLENQLEKMMEAARHMGFAAAEGGAAPGEHLRETRNFGSNPGALRMFSYLPPQAAPSRALVVVLHGCMQSAEGYDLGAGWSTLAKRFGFALLLPEQQRANNPSGCFNWFQTGDIERGQGEALSILQMVDKMIADRTVDPERVFATGLSAGGAMTSVMLATYPDVFSGGAIIAGLPYGAANNAQQAFETMFQCPPRSPRVWGDLVRRASPHRGPWPRVSVWHGGADATVIPGNADEIIKQWTDVHGLPARPSASTTVDGYPRAVWIDQGGRELIESYTIPHMAHGTPLATGEADHECGAAGPFLLEVGISSSYHIAKFFGLTAEAVSKAAKPSNKTNKKTAKAAAPALALGQPQPPFVPPDVLDGEILGPEPVAPSATTKRRKAKPASPTLPIDIGAVITKALKASGLMKE